MKKKKKDKFSRNEIIIIFLSIICIIFIAGMFIYDGKQQKKLQEEARVLNKESLDNQIVKQEKIREINNKISEIKKEVKPAVLLNFDWYSGMYEDRYKIVKEQYGFNATFCLDSQTANYNLDDTLTRNQFNEMIEKGWDYAFYGGIGEYPGVDKVNSSSYKEEWNDFISGLVDQKNNIGISTPTTYFCPNNACGDVLAEVLKENGFKLARTMSVADSPYIKWIDENTVMTGTDCIRSTNLNDVKSHIDTAIKNNWALPIFTHKLVDSIDEEENGMHCYIGTYIELLDYIKTKVDSGELEVLTYAEYYDKMMVENEKISELKKEIEALN